MFVYQRGMAPKGDMALDDMTVVPGDCSSTPPTRPHGKKWYFTVSLRKNPIVLQGYELTQHVKKKHLFPPVYFVLLDLPFIGAGPLFI